MDENPKGMPAETLQVGVAPLQEFDLEMVTPLDPHPVRFGRPPRPAPEDRADAADRNPPPV